MTDNTILEVRCINHTKKGGDDYGVLSLDGSFAGDNMFVAIRDRDDAASIFMSRDDIKQVRNFLTDFLELTRKPWHPDEPVEFTGEHAYECWVPRNGICREQCSCKCHLVNG